MQYLHNIYAVSTQYVQSIYTFLANKYLVFQTQWTPWTRAGEWQQTGDCQHGVNTPTHQHTGQQLRVNIPQHINTLTPAATKTANIRKFWLQLNSSVVTAATCRYRHNDNYKFYIIAGVARPRGVRNFKAIRGKIRGINSFWDNTSARNAWQPFQTCPEFFLSHSIRKVRKIL